MDFDFFLIHPTSIPSMHDLSKNFNCFKNIFSLYPGMGDQSKSFRTEFKELDAIFYHH